MEQLRKTTNWSHLAQDFFDHNPLGVAQTPQLISHQLNEVTYKYVQTVLKSIAVNLKAYKPVQCLFVGVKGEGTAIDE